MREASRLGARGHNAAAAAFYAGASEFEVHQAYCSAVGLREQELPYGNIIAFGEGAACCTTPRSAAATTCRGRVS